MWYKNFDIDKKVQMRCFFAVLAGVILALILIYDIILQHKKEERPTTRDYMKIESLNLGEYLPGGHNHLKINFRNNTISYNIYYEGHFTEEEKYGLISLLEEYKLLEWLNGRFYWNLAWNDCSARSYVLNPDAKSARRTDFVSLNRMDNYLGMGRDEFWLRPESCWAAYGISL